MRVAWLKAYQIGNYQFFRQWAEEAWHSAGGAVKNEMRLPWKLKMLIGKIGLARHLGYWLKGDRKLIVGVCGKVEYFAWPWCYFYEIIPIVWDCWPKYWTHLVRFVKRNRVKTIFCTSRQTAEMVRKACDGVKVIWLPEGIKASLYPMGPKLSERNTDIMRFGRDVNGELRYPTQESLTAAMRDSKIMICRPRCDTNPEHAEGLETLTQRYWEGMLSGCVIVGRAPRELIDFCGYNPVVEIDVTKNEELERILSHIESYQELVDRNRAFAEKNSDWNSRVEIVSREVLREDV